VVLFYICDLHKILGESAIEKTNYEKDPEKPQESGELYPNSNTEPQDDIKDRNFSGNEIQANQFK